jgi:hypothetical protein
MAFLTVLTLFPKRPDAVHNESRAHAPRNFPLTMKHKKFFPRALGAIAASLLLSSAFAAGKIDLIEGNVSVTNAAGQLRIPGSGERIEAGDTISTGRDGEIQVHMDDNGLIAVRANTYLKIESYKAEGGADDNAVFRLLKGSFRSVTGWIGKINPQRYAVRTSTATIGVRGTDHETLVIEEGADAGTYDKVTTGETELATRLGKVSVLPGHAAYTPKAGLQAPMVLAAIPPVFVVGKHEDRVEASKKLLEETRDDRLKKKQADNERKGLDKNGKARIGDPQGGRNALGAFEGFLRAYESGNLSLIRQQLDPSMIGYQQLLDSIAKENNECKQMRVELLDTQVQAGPDLAVIQTNWEKRCLLLPAFTPKLTKGHSTVLLHLGAAGWSFAAITGGNPFDKSSTTTVATLAVANTGASYGGAPVLPGSSGQPFSITVNDPDRVGVASIAVTFTTTGLPNNDTQTLTLPAIGSGKFGLTNVNFSKATGGGAAPCANGTPSNPNALEICPGTNVVVTFTDNTTPSGVPVTLTKSVSIP